MRGTITKDIETSSGLGMDAGRALEEACTHHHEMRVKLRMMMTGTAPRAGVDAAYQVALSQINREISDEDRHWLGLKYSAGVRPEMPPYIEELVSFAALVVAGSGYNWHQMPLVEFIQAWREYLGANPEE